jgi:G3E family GTPase
VKSTYTSITCRQIACADVILLNKRDLISEDRVRETEIEIRTINSTVPILHSTKGRVALSSIIGLDAYSAYPSLHDSLAHLSHTHNDGSGDHDHSPGDGITSIVVTLPTLTSSQLDALDRWIRTVLWEGRLPEQSETSDTPKIEVLRCKGICVSVSGEYHVLQGVRTLYEFRVLGDKGGEKDEQQSKGKIALIGCGLDETVSRSLLASLNSVALRVT